MKRKAKRNGKKLERILLDEKLTPIEKLKKVDDLFRKTLLFWDEFMGDSS